MLNAVSISSAESLVFAYYLDSPISGQRTAHHEMTMLPRSNVVNFISAISTSGENIGEMEHGSHQRL
jgi:hypothetical protein